MNTTDTQTQEERGLFRLLIMIVMFYCLVLATCVGPRDTSTADVRTERQELRDVQQKAFADGAENKLRGAMWRR